MNSDDVALVQRFEAAIRRGEDPVNASGSFRKVTTVDSPWAMDFCTGCRHRFRLDDVVQATYDDNGSLREVRHLDPLLHCATGAGLTGEAADDRALVERLYAAADKADPQPSSFRLERLNPGHPLLADKPRRDQCPRCVSSFRPFEVVVVCPCELDCHRAVHQDVNRGLTCFDAMLMQHKAVVCLMTKQPRVPQ